jgi:predicted secreted Zn-dependent protease
MRRQAWIAVLVLLAYFGVKNWQKSATIERPKETPAPNARPALRDERAVAPPEVAPSVAPTTVRLERTAAPPPRPVLSDPIVEQRIEYYDVSGRSARELSLAMARLGPRHGEVQLPRSHIATTSWQVSWEIDYWPGGASCAIKSFSTRVKVHIILPRWTDRVTGHPLTERWDSFVQAVSWHEQGHADHGILAAKAIQQRVAALAPAGSCRELETSITSAARTIIDRYRKEDVDYDWRRTRDAVFDDEETDWLYGLRPRPITPPAMVDAEMADTDRQRQAGTTQLEADLAGLSVRADEVDSAWSAYREQCRLAIRAATPSGSRAWFAYAWGSETARGAVACAEGMAFYSLVEAIKDRMCAAEEKARRSSVYPGTRRELRARYRLEWDGWDRVCP